jgi:hypothetical protein
MPRFRHSFAKKASEAELIELASIVLSEADETVKALLLLMFHRRPFPLDIAPLMEYAQSENEFLSGNAIDRLKYIKDIRIHDFAMRLLDEKGLDSFALGLLEMNYRKADDDIIYRLIKIASNIPQHVQSDIVDIYTHHRSADALPILSHVYSKGICTHCRCGILRAMNHCKVLSDEILDECLYDSYEDTRKLAKRLKSRRE